MEPTGVGVSDFKIYHGFLVMPLSSVPSNASMKRAAASSRREEDRRD
jgi:hypothetical protein